VPTAIVEIMPRGPYTARLRVVARTVLSNP
jgi:hypothetical protein